MALRKIASTAFDIGGGLLQAKGAHELDEESRHRSEFRQDARDFFNNMERRFTTQDEFDQFILDAKSRYPGAETEIEQARGRGEQYLLSQDERSLAVQSQPNFPYMSKEQIEQQTSVVGLKPYNKPPAEGPGVYRARQAPGSESSIDRLTPGTLERGQERVDAYIPPPIRTTQGVPQETPWLAPPSPDATIDSITSQKQYPAIPQIQTMPVDISAARGAMGRPILESINRSSTMTTPQARTPISDLLAAQGEAQQSIRRQAEHTGEIERGQTQLAWDEVGKGIQTDTAQIQSDAAFNQQRRVLEELDPQMRANAFFDYTRQLGLSHLYTIAQHEEISKMDHREQMKRLPELLEMANKMAVAQAPMQYQLAFNPETREVVQLEYGGGELARGTNLPFRKELSMPRGFILMGPEQMQQMMATLLPQLFANAASTAAIGGGGYDWRGNPDAAIRIIEEIIGGLPEELQGQFRGTGGPAEGADIPTFEPNTGSGGMQNLIPEVFAPSPTARQIGQGIADVAGPVMEAVGSIPANVASLAREIYTDTRNYNTYIRDVKPEYSGNRAEIVQTFQRLAAPESNATPEELQAFRDTYFIPSQK
jgi:hypothetical protein